MLSVSCSSATVVSESDYFRVFDTAGILGRDLKKCREFAAEWLRPEALQKEPKASNVFTEPPYPC
jgi:hypothetical protein